MWQWINGCWYQTGIAAGTGSTTMVCYVTTSTTVTNTTYCTGMAYYNNERNPWLGQQVYVGQVLAGRNAQQETDDFYRRHEVQQAKELAKHKKDALARARELLLDNLTAGQRRTFEEHKWFVVVGGKSKNKYRINDKGTLVANIDVMSHDNDNIPIRRLCCHCNTREIPLYDHLLAQKIMLELDEATFLRLANTHPLARAA